MTADSDIRIRIFGKDADSVYRVEAQTDDGGFFQDQMQLAAAEQNDLLASESDPLQYGIRLSRILFSPNIAAAYQQALGRSKASGTGRVRIRLWISSDCADLHAYSWERLLVDHDGNSLAAACAPALPFSRYTGLGQSEAKTLKGRGGHLRLLVVVSNPTGLPQGFVRIDVRNELNELLGVLKDVDGLEVTVLPGRTTGSAEEFPDFAAQKKQWEEAGFTVEPGPLCADALKSSLREQDIVHILAHGSYSPTKRSSLLFLENGDGTLNAVLDQEIVQTLQNLSPLPSLVFLASCDGAKRATGDARAFVSLGPKLVEAGFPAVVAMQSKVPVNLAHRLTLDFYRNLFDHGAIDLALNQSRSFLFSTQEADWSIPVLFMRVPNGQLFTPDPVLAALHAMAEGSVFAERPLISELPLEAVVLTGRQLEIKGDGNPHGRMPRSWKRAVASALYRVDVATQIAEMASSSSHSFEYNLTVLIGDRGAETGAFLKRLVRETARGSLARSRQRSDGPETENGAPQMLPLYVDLAGYPSTVARGTSRLRALLLASLQPFWPADLKSPDFDDLLASDHKSFRIVLDNGDDLPSTVRDEILHAVHEFAENHPRNEYYFALDPTCWNLSDVKVTGLVAMQPLARHRVDCFLRQQTGPLQRPMSQLATALGATGLYDLAARPWLLLHMADQALQDRLPQGRAHVLGSVLDDRIQQIPVERGQQSRARESLEALAMRMQISYAEALPVHEAFETLAEVRGNREYNLEELLDRLIGEKLLEQTPEGSVRFPYAFLQSYCCARALAENKNRGVLEQVTAGLGRPKYLKWWEESLVLLSGLMDYGERVRLVERIAYGSTLTEGDHLFLAAHCLHESGLAGKETAVAQQILDALMFRADSGNESRIPRRVLAVRALGDFAPPEALPYLWRIARQKARTAWNGEAVFEYGAVRQAAVRALYRMPGQWDKLEDEPFVNVLRSWRDEDVANLSTILAAQPNGGEPEKTSLSGVAAFALGDLQFNPAAREALYAAFNTNRTDRDTLWSIADALLALDPKEVAQRIIRPRADSARPEKLWSEWDHLLLYLVTQLRLPDPWALQFVESYLQDPKAITGCKGRALLALGMLNAQEWRGRLVSVALGDFATIQARNDDSEAPYLRQKALEALAEIGSMRELEDLRKGRPTAGWTPQLNRVFYETSESISSRESELS
jgi:hypothetical protein